MEQLKFSQCEVKSKYINEWQYRTITINSPKNILGIGNHGTPFFKYFNLNEVKVQQKSARILCIQVSSGRIYEIKGQKVSDLIEAIHSCKFLYEHGPLYEISTICKPKKIDYSQHLQNVSVTSSIHRQIATIQPIRKEKQYCRQKSYYKEEDWAINSEDGGLILISQQKKRNQGKIIKFVLKKFITTGAFMGISFPVFAMKPESILETFCKSIASAPVIFKQYKQNPIERMKQFVCFCFSFSRLFTDMDKPFNPTIGQTFQADIAGGIYSAEQTSHHPPQSSIYFQGNGYRIHATLELVAQIGINSATGMVQGDIVIQFQRGGKIIGRSLEGEMKGFVLGENKFRPDGSCYSYDLENDLVCSYKRTDKDIFRGFIGKLNQSSRQAFNKLLKTKQRFTHFQAFQRNQFEHIESGVEACWSQYVKFNTNQYINFNDPSFLPYQPTCQDHHLLSSDSRFRSDIKLRREEKFEESQQQKQRIEEQQRNLRKLRASFKKRNQIKLN